MKKTELMNSVSRNFNKFGFTIKKHSPEILVVTGIVGMVTSAVLACKASTKVNAILEEAKETVDAIHRIAENNESGEYSKEDTSRALTITYTKTGLELAKLYAPAVTIGAVSITSILVGHNILNKRNVALAAAYATVDTGFKEYRNRVIERFGKELDRELRYDIKSKEIDETVVGEDGTETTIKKTIEVVDDPNTYSIYSRVYDDGCKGWTKDPEYNYIFLKQTQNYANDKLKAQGYLFLNEVYDMLGIPRSKAGQVVGWVYDEKNPIGDNYVDFGIYDIYRERVRAFVNGYERTIILDFNVDGNVWELMA